ncbi:MAG: cytochrome oxidase putative small subunit CydP [Rhodanobacter sp.]
MSSSASSSPSAGNIKAQSKPLHRLTAELFVVIALKIALLTLIWWVAFAPQPKPDVSPDAIAHRLAPISQTPPEGHP